MDTSCSKPKLSSYNFMRFLCATLAKDKNVIVNFEKIVPRIYQFKETLSPNLQYLFEDIEFRVDIDNVISSDIEESINNLRMLGIISKSSSPYEKTVIYLTEQDAALILQNCALEISNTMACLANHLLNF